MKNILVINSHQNDILSFKNAIRSLSIKFNTKVPKIYPEDENIDEYCNDLVIISRYEKNKLHMFIEKYIAKYNIDVVLLDFFLNNDDLDNLNEKCIHNISGAEVLKTLVEKEIIIIGYTYVPECLLNLLPNFNKISFTIDSEMGSGSIIDFFTRSHKHIKYYEFITGTKQKKTVKQIY